MPETMFPYSTPYEQFKNWAVACSTGSYSDTDTVINLSVSAETGRFPVNLPFKLIWANVSDYPSIYDDPNVEIIKVTGIHSSGFYVARAQEGTTGTNKVSNKTHVLLQSPISNDYEDKWKYFNNPDNTVYLFDDFDWGSLTSTVLGWTTSSNAGGGFSALGASTAKRAGLVGLRETATNTGNVLCRLNDKLVRLDSGPLTYKTAIQLFATNNESTISIADWRFGLGDAISASSFSGDVTNGLYFQRTTTDDSGRIYICSAKDGVISRTATEYTGLIALASASVSPYRDYRIDVVNSGTVRFYINNQEVSGSPLTTNIPWGSGYEVGPFYYLQESTGTSVFFYTIDSCELYQNFTGQRTQPLLMTDLVSYWPLYETGGIAYDSHGSNHLTGISSNPIGTGGILISGRAFNGQNQGLFTNTHNCHGSGSGIGLSIFGWFNSRRASSSQTIISAYNTSITGAEWRVRTISDTVQFLASPTGATAAAFSAISSTFETGKWNFFCAFYDNTINKMGVRLNNSYSSLTTITGLFNGDSPLSIGYLKNNSFTDPFSGYISEIGVIQRVLTTGEMDFLYNNSGAMAYPYNHFNEQ